jgi:hypothetical protein
MLSLLRATADGDALAGETVVEGIVVDGDEDARQERLARESGQSEARTDLELQLALDGVFHRLSIAPAVWNRAPPRFKRGTLDLIQ